MHSGLTDDSAANCDFTGATSLLLRRNRITSFDRLQLPPALEELDLYDNLVSSLPALVEGLACLHFLDVSYNRLAAVDHLPFMSLRRLFLSSNKISSFSPNALPLQLETIELGDNRLTTVPRCLLQLQALRELWLGSNRIEAGADFSALPALEKLSLQANSLCGEVQLSFSQSGVATFLLPRSLVEFYLSENSITSVVVTGDCPGEALRVLDLSKNRISEIDRSLASAFPSLSDFWVNDNQLLSLERVLDALRGIPSLRSLYLAGNRCTQIVTYQAKVRLALGPNVRLDSLFDAE